MSTFDNIWFRLVNNYNSSPSTSGADPGFQVRGAHLKKLRRAEGGAKMCWGISCEKSRFYAKKSYFFKFYRGHAGCASLPGSAPGHHWVNWNQTLQVLCWKVSSTEVQSLDPIYSTVDIGNFVIKTKANLPGTGHHSRFWLSCLGCLDIFFPKTFIFFSFPIY